MSFQRGEVNVESLFVKINPCVVFEILVPPWMLLVSIVEALALHPTVDSHTCTD